MLPRGGSVRAGGHHPFALAQRADRLAVARSRTGAAGIPIGGSVSDAVSLGGGVCLGGLAVGGAVVSAPSRRFGPGFAGSVGVVGRQHGCNNSSTSRHSGGSPN